MLRLIPVPETTAPGAGLATGVAILAGSAVAVYAAVRMSLFSIPAFTAMALMVISVEMVKAVEYTVLFAVGSLLSVV